MKNKSVLFWIFVSLFLISGETSAQFNTPTIDGVISANEYGVHVDGQNQKNTTSAQTWYLSWDNTNLYVAVTNANLAEGAVIAIDRNPVSPSNGGTNADGTLAALNYDGTAIGNYPFRADFRAYFKDGYRDYQTANGSNGWNFGASNFGTYASGAGNVREFAIPWSSITGGGRPSSFLFLAYLNSSGGYIYGQVPQGNTEGNSPGDYNRYYAVVNTENGTATKPFSLDQTVGSGDIQYLGLKHDTFDTYYRSPFGAVTTNSSVNLKFRTDLLDVSGVYMKIYKYNPQTNTTDPAVELPLNYLENRTENGTTYSIYSINYTAPATPSIIYYKFRIVDGASQAFYSDSYIDDHDNLGQGGDGAASPGEPFSSFQLTVYASNFTTPAWLQNAAVYQVFPDRFRNGDITNDWCRSGNTTGCPNLYGGNGATDNIIQTTWNTQMVDPRATGNNNAYSAQFYGGDLKGIQDKLDYIKGLGFNTIYLNPVFKARSNHRYDADDFLGIAPELGGNAAFQNLVTAANSRGMKLILDGVWNHMSQDSEYFDYYNRMPGANGACESLSSPYRSLFNFFNNNTPCQYRPDLTPPQVDYEGWFGFGGLPVFNENDAVKDFFYRTPTTNVTQYWYDRGASGWRFDVATDISHQWWNEYRGYAKTFKSDGPLIGEIFQDASQYLAGDQLDSVMNYRFRKNVLGFSRGFDWEDNDNNGSNKINGLTPSQFNRAMMAIREDYPLPAQRAMLNLIDSHDTNRALFTLKNNFESTGEAKQRLKLAALFQFTYIGAPMVYYGDEAAINAPSYGNSGSGLAEDDPYNRAPYPWSDETGNQSVYGPVDSDMVSYYSVLGGLRNNNSALRTGSFASLLTGDTTASATDNNTFAFVRSDASRSLIVVMNNGTTSNTATIPVGSYFADGTELTDAFSSSLAPNVSVVVSGGQINVTIPARSGFIFSNFAPTAANASISGKVTNNSGRPIFRANVELINEKGERQSVLTNSFGFYQFDDVQAGQTYVLRVRNRNNQSIQQVITINDSISDLNFVLDSEMGNLKRK